jgi:hypothetical protein
LQDGGKPLELLPSAFTTTR